MLNINLMTTRHLWKKSFKLLKMKLESCKSHATTIITSFQPFFNPLIYSFLPIWYGKAVVSHSKVLKGLIWGT